jgi:transcriptional regulator with XRE-family HTH domain
MPKPPKRKHPLRVLREVLSEGKIKLSQESFAKRFGTKRTVINNAETGTSPLKKEVALRIAEATGVAAKSIMQKEGPALDFQGRPYTSSSLRMW